MPPASSMSFSSLPANIMRPKSASSGKTLRADSNRQRRSRPSSSTSPARSAFLAERARRASRRWRAASMRSRSARSRGAILSATGCGRPSTPTLTNTRCEFSVTARSPVATFSDHTRTPTSSEDRPTYSTCARRIARSPTRSGWRKSRSSSEPSATVPRATRAAAKVPTCVIHSIIRPPWICPGAPACSGKTHWVSSVTVSATDGMEQLFLPLSESGVEEIPEAVAEQVDAEHRQEERHTREDRDPGRRDQEGLPLRQHGPPRDRRRLGAEPEEGESGLGDHVAADPDRRGDQERAEAVGEHVADEDRRVRDAHRPRRLHVLLASERQDLAADHAGDGGPAEGAEDQEDFVEARLLEDGDQPDREDQGG